MAESLRCFVAVNLPRDMREVIGEFVSSLARKVRGVRWVKPENLHLTLKFLGRVERASLPELERTLEEAVAGHCSFTVKCCGAGIFPPRGRPRVVWLDIAAGATEMTALQAAIDAAVATLGYAPEARSFSPHLTLGRARNLRETAPLMTELSSAGQRQWGEFMVREVHLMRSELFPTGPRYSILHAVRLAPQEAPDREEGRG